MITEVGHCRASLSFFNLNKVLISFQFVILFIYILGWNVWEKVFVGQWNRWVVRVGVIWCFFFLSFCVQSVGCHQTQHFEPWINEDSCHHVCSDTFHIRLTKDASYTVGFIKSQQFVYFPVSIIYYTLGQDPASSSPPLTKKLHKEMNVDTNSSSPLNIGSLNR